jgi:hypothetical protein
MHRVLLLGPRGDLNATIVLLVIADFPDTDIDGKGAVIPGRLIARRAQITHWKARATVGRLTADGWLEVVKASSQRRPAVYRLGPRFTSWPVEATSGVRRQVGKPRSERETPTYDRTSGVRRQVAISRIDVSTSIDGSGAAAQPMAGVAADKEASVPPGRLCGSGCPTCGGIGWLETEVPRGHVMRCPNALAGAR